MRIKIPYGGEFMAVDVPDPRIKAVLRSETISEKTEKKDEQEIVVDALIHPIGSSALNKLAAGKRNITIITSDHTRPMPSKITMPLLLNEIRKGSPDANILILVATGLHRATNSDELISRFGHEIFQNEKIIVHDCRDESVMRKIGTMPSGGILELSRYALDTDLLIAEGFIEPHFFAGFSGGRKSVHPGVAGYDCIISNHCSRFIADKNASAGVLKSNPIHKDMEFAAKEAGLAFILNVILGEGRVIIDAVSGDPVQAHNEGVERLLKKNAVKKTTAPIVITSNGGYPLDQNLYQLVKCMDTAEKCCEEGGVIIAVGECRDGTGSESFYQDFASGDSPSTLLKRFLSRSPTETKTDQWQSQILARIMEKRHIIVVAPLIEEIVKNMGLGFAVSIDDAVKQADFLLDRPQDDKAKIIVAPDGIGIIVT